ncbi:AAA family ATPase [Mesorhizobium sp. M7A.F.Ca.US.008.03.1.1]|uniref:AAA family ATPase n=1 Tax=Mesorhizobium sp. M7A.F.Ca.US.008.03.1.1 TaxID=2496742 RepID=UPI0013DF8521|nr:AAA family ATPase [Mesorhizobium sp. M7A.F.Ca.US.008.03.1.1]
MINFPVFEDLEVHDFGLYPGTASKPGLSVVFKPGLTLVLGANGLGKTTLISIIFRLLTGPFDIPALMSRADLGNASLKIAGLSAGGKAIFAQRVTDGARGSTARLTFKIGQDELVVERRLRDLALTSFTVNGTAKKTDDLMVFQPTIAKMAGVWSFGDWILLLRHMIFYFEDRRELVWDSSAQRQLLRTLLLPPAVAQAWTEDERAILELDSRMRNLRFAAYREEQALTEVETKARRGTDVRQELKTLEALQTTDVARREKLDSTFVELDSRRQHARLRLLKAQQERESRYREFERAKLRAVEARFPKKSDTARYILEQLFAEANCLVCGNHVPHAAALLEQRIAANDCVICGSDLSGPNTDVPAAKMADSRAKKVQTSLEAIEPELSEAEQQLTSSETEFDKARFELAELDAKIGERTARIDLLIQRLPPSEQDIHKQRSELASMRSRVEALTKELTDKRTSFSEFVDAQNRAMARQSAAIMAAFSGFAGGFLLETVNLVWAPQRARIGQTGEPIEFPAFELDMTGTNFPTAVRRTGPEHVSESQREFIDLAFRMALMQVASANGSSSLVIDAPESSLDAVFVTRAADVLARYGDSAHGNRLVTTSNLVEGELIPELLKRSAPSGDRVPRVIDLFTIAAPTAAIRQLGHEYTRIMKALLAKVEPHKKRAATRAAPAKPRRSKL